MVSIHIDALSRLEITDMQQTFPVLIFSDDQHVRCPKTRRSDMAVIHPLLHQYQGFDPIPLHLFDNRNDELRIHIGDLIDLLCVKLL